MWNLAGPLIAKVAGKLIGKVLKDKVPDAVIEAAKAALPEAAEDPEVREEFDAEWAKFQTEFYGKMSELPRPVQILRACVRPVVSLALVGSIIYAAVTGSLAWETPATMAIAVISFLFGERAGLKTPGK